MELEELRKALEAVALAYADLADKAMKQEDRYLTAKMVRRELEALNRARAADLGHLFRI